MEKQNSRCKNRQSIEQTKGLFCMCDSGVARYQSHRTPVSLLVNEFDVRSVLHRQVSLAAVNQILLS